MQHQGTSNVRDLFVLGLQHHRAGRLEQAEHIYGEILKADPAHPDTLQLLGVLAHQRGDHARATDLIGKALVLSPASPPFITTSAMP